MIKVGITGGIGSGKTTVCKLFETLDIPVYYADDRAKKIMTSDKQVKQAIITTFGKDAFYGNGRLNRKYMAASVFRNKPLLKKLNAIVHPAVKRDGEQWFHEQRSPFAVKEAALLIESGSYKDMDILIVVSCPLEIRINRVMERDGFPREAILKRINNQMPEEEKIPLANFIIVNDGKRALIPQVMKIYKKLLKMK